jgi:membrane protein implicated in regulation of membrane protease activity
MINFVESWWDTLNFSLQVFYGIAIVALIFLVFQMITTFVFGMDDASGGVDISHHDSGMSIFSVRGITAFFTGFGWTGVICTKSGMALIPSVAIAFVVGSSLMLLIYLMMRSLMRLQSSGTLDYSNAVGQIATVYLTISPVQRPGGQVEVMIQGRLVTAEALQKGSQPLSPGTKVKIVDKIGLTALLVEPLD